MVEYMDHSGLPLYLILHPEEIEDLKEAKPIGLEVNLPKCQDSMFAVDIHNRGRKNPRADLIFKKGDDLYLVEIVDKEKITLSHKKKVKCYVRRLKEILGPGFQHKIVPIIVQPENPIPSLWPEHFLGAGPRSISNP